MKPSDEIKALERQLTALREQQRQCKHEWDQTKYDPDTKSEGYGYHYVGCGSDPYLEASGYRDVEVPRWSRECVHCGYKEYTTEREAIIKEYQPKFKT